MLYWIMHHVQCYNMILKITFYQLKEFSKVQKNGLSEKQPFWATPKRLSQTIFKVGFSEHFPKFLRDADMVDSFN